MIVMFRGLKVVITTGTFLYDMEETSRSILINK